MNLSISAIGPNKHLAKGYPLLTTDIVYTSNDLADSEFTI